MTPTNYEFTPPDNTKTRYNFFNFGEVSILVQGMLDKNKVLISQAMLCIANQSRESIDLPFLEEKVKQYISPLGHY